jgi:hypothetical protein
MTIDSVFAVCNLLAVAGWLPLILLPRARWTGVVAGRVVPLVLAGVYVIVVGLNWAGHAGGFSSLEGVAELFSNRWLLLAGWVHYLAFDLFVGTWEARDAAKREVPHLLVVPCLALTFLFGPAGLLCYFAVRSGRAVTSARTRRESTQLA